MKFKLFPRRKRQAKNNYSSENTCQPLFRNQSFIDYLLDKNETQLAAYQAVSYFDRCAPLFDAIDRICYAFSIIDPIVYDEKNKEFVEDHPVIELLKNPNLEISGSDFMYSLLAFLILTGNSYIVGSGLNQNSPPSQLFIRHPQQIYPRQTSDGSISSYTLNTGSESKIYKRTPDLDEGMRYLSTSSGIFSELFPLKTFNPVSHKFGVIGSSILNSIYYDIEQFISAGKHNLSLLKRGTTLSGVFKVDGAMPDDQQMERLRAQINEYFSGDQNSGRPFLAGNLDFTPSQQSNRDMDFLELKKGVESTIYKNLKIPPPLISGEFSSFANMNVSIDIFYDQGVIPWLERIYDSLTKFLMPKYDNSEDLVIWYNIKDIPALEARRIDNIKNLQETNAFTTNQIRAELGEHPMQEGGKIYMPAGLVPTIIDQEDDT
jgi:HK97 family phage portal protein